jgi:ParB family chromosome partitioning protein
MSSGGDFSERDEVFRRLQERGDARRMLEVLPKLDAESADRLKGILLARRPLPVAEAQGVVAGPSAVAAGVAAHLLGRAGPEAVSAAPAVAATLRRWWDEWDRGRQEETRRGRPAGSVVGPLANPLASLVWAAGRLGVAADTLVSIASTRVDLPFDRTLRRQAVAALGESPPSKPILATLERFATGDDPDIRALAAEAVARADESRGTILAGKALADRVTFNRLVARAGEGVAATLRGAIAQVHHQGVAVPHLVARSDVAGLAAVASNPGFSEETRLGAVEGLAAAATEAAEAELVRVGQSAEHPEELRKAAWRGLRRSKRARQKAASGGASAPC